MSTSRLYIQTCLLWLAERRINLIAAELSIQLWPPHHGHHNDSCHSSPSSSDFTMPCGGPKRQVYGHWLDTEDPWSHGEVRQGVGKGRQTSVES